MPQTLPPTSDQVAAISPLLRQNYPLPSSELDAIVTQATAQVQSVTWRILNPDLGCAAPEGYQCEGTPAGLLPVAIAAVARMSERIAVTTGADFTEELASGRLLRGFSAGPYSEQYFAPGEFARRGAQQGRPQMDADDQLDAALWALATEDARDYFVYRATGQAPPTGQAIGFDYRRESLGYGGGVSGAMPARGGPDGW